MLSSFFIELLSSSLFKFSKFFVAVIPSFIFFFCVSLFLFDDSAFVENVKAGSGSASASAAALWGRQAGSPPFSPFSFVLFFFSFCPGL